VLLRSDYCCAYCNEQLGPRSATLDHIIPKVLGGLTVPENLCGACITCNGSKGHRDWRDWFRAQPFYNLTREEAIDSWQRITSVILHIDFCLPQIVGVPANATVLTASAIHRLLAKAVV
jgi:hypothetical protein